MSIHINRDIMRKSLVATVFLMHLSSLCIILYLVELAQRGNEICPLTRGLKVSQRFLNDRRIATVTIVILQL